MREKLDVEWHRFGKLKNCVRWANPLPLPIHCIFRIQCLGRDSGFLDGSYRTSSNPPSDYPVNTFLKYTGFGGPPVTKKLKNGSIQIIQKIP